LALGADDVDEEDESEEEDSEVKMHKQGNW
jgi:hypothetical protein